MAGTEGKGREHRRGIEKESISKATLLIPRSCCLWSSWPMILLVKSFKSQLILVLLCQSVFEFSMLSLKRDQ